MSSHTEEELEWFSEFLQECNVTVTITDFEGNTKTLLDTDECGDVELTLDVDPTEYTTPPGTRAVSSERRLSLHIDTPHPEPMVPADSESEEYAGGGD